jgi:hypothetical protein
MKEKYSDSFMEFQDLHDAYVITQVELTTKKAKGLPITEEERMDLWEKRRNVTYFVMGILEVAHKSKQGSVA